MPWPTPMHIVQSARRSRPSLQLDQRGHRQPRAAHAERMAERDGAAVRVHVLGVVRQAQLAHDGEGLRRKGLVELDHVDLRDLQPEPLPAASASPAPGRSP